MYSKSYLKNEPLWLFSSLVGVAILYLGLIWKTTLDIDRLTTESLFWGIILWLLWKKKDSIRYTSDPISSFVGLLLLGLALSKTITLFQFESIFLFLLPPITAIALALIASGFKGLSQYVRELFFAGFLFFPTGAAGYLIDNNFHITVMNAKVATYFLYYLGFNTASSGNEVILYLPESGTFKAIVNLPCAGVPMILLIFKLALLLICCVPLSRNQQVIIPAFSIVLGFLLGVVRVCLLTLFIPNHLRFDYWHGTAGSQIFSTLAIAIFAGFCYWILEKDRGSVVGNKKSDVYN